MLRRMREIAGDILIGSPPENDWADASLMAAAPDLLEALKRLHAASWARTLNFCKRTEDEFDSALIEAELAIARAEWRVA